MRLQSLCSWSSASSLNSLNVGKGRKLLPISRKRCGCNVAFPLPFFSIDPAATCSRPLAKTRRTQQGNLRIWLASQFPVISRNFYSGSYRYQQRRYSLRVISLIKTGFTRLRLFDFTQKANRIRVKRAPDFPNFEIFSARLTSAPSQSLRERDEAGRERHDRGKRNNPSEKRPRRSHKIRARSSPRVCSPRALPRANEHRYACISIGEADARQHVPAVFRTCRGGGGGGGGRRPRNAIRSSLARGMLRLRTRSSAAFPPRGNSMMLRIAHVTHCCIKFVCNRGRNWRICPFLS